MDRAVSQLLKANKCIIAVAVVFDIIMIFRQPVLFKRGHKASTAFRHDTVVCTALRAEICNMV